MDILEYLPQYRIVLCKLCKSAIHPSALPKHCRKAHGRRHLTLFSNSNDGSFEKETLPALLEQSLLDPRIEPLPLPQTECEPFVHLRVEDGFGCNYCTLVSKTVSVLRKHYNVEHAPLRRSRGGQKSSGSRAVRETLEREHFGGQTPWKAVKFQRFFRKGPGSAGFRVKHCIDQPLGTDGRTDLQAVGHVENHDAGTEEVFRKLAMLEEQHAHATSVFQDNPAKTQVSPWLERTRWPNYLHGVRLAEAAQLARLPDPEECILTELTSSIDRLIESAYATVNEDKVNFFAQRCISSFLPHKKAYGQPLMVKLQKPTYQRYKDTWKRLLCFAYRTNDPYQSPRLRHILTSRQVAILDELIAVTSEQQNARTSQDSSSSGASSDRHFRRIDDLCLDFCIAVLDHQLKGDIYESVVLGFLAVLGVDTGSCSFFEALNYTSRLSGFIKISQMLVLEAAVRAMESGKVDNPLDPLEEMRQRFMTVDNCTPFSWAVSLRSFGKQIRDSTTSLGYIQWSDDEQTVHYKDVELTMQSFRRFILVQVQRVQNLLSDVLMLGVDEAREDMIPMIHLHRLRDNPAVIENGWNFLDDERNRALLPCKKGWLLHRVLRTDRLREQFTYHSSSQHVVWDKQAVRQYHKQVDAFLEGLLLLIHITSGQPARGSEITSLQHTNSTFHRNMFIEHGLVALVTSYHKGYTCTGSTKIIHRYLPKEVSELVVYYLWMVLPFLRELDLLVPSKKSRATSFLWPDGDGCWNSQRLSNVLKRATAGISKAPMTIPIYRHVAIAISRRHLNGGGFKRDYDIGDQITDLQTTHTSWTAGRLYARGLEEVPGHVEARRAGFRLVSREWHEFLGFGARAGSGKRPVGDSANQVGAKRQRS